MIAAKTRPVETALQKLCDAALRFKAARDTVDRNPSDRNIERQARRMLDLCDCADDYAREAAK